MAIVQTRHVIGGRDFIRTVSDAGRYVVRGGINYEEAYDPVEFERHYTEGDYIPPEPGDEATADDYEAALNRLG